MSFSPSDLNILEKIKKEETFKSIFLMGKIIFFLKFNEDIYLFMFSIENVEYFIVLEKFYKNINFFLFRILFSFEIFE